MYSRTCRVLALHLYLPPLILAFLLPAPANARAAYQVADLHTVGTGGTEEFPFNVNFTRLDTGILMALDDGVHGAELWRTDGTAAGTELVADICPGACASRIFWMTVVGGAAYFAADDEVHGWELWTSDGTPEGTRMVTDLRPGLRGSNPSHLIAFDGALYFGADDGVSGRELWRSDGTAAGTVLVADSEPGPRGSAPQPWAVVGSRLVFDARDPVQGNELWATDGTAGGTALLLNIQAGSGSAVNFQIDLPGFHRFALLGDQLLFEADDGVAGPELWKTDGTAAGTEMVKDISPGFRGSHLRSFLAQAGRVYFAANDGVHGWELWASDGTEVGTVLIKDIRPGFDSSAPAQLASFAGGVVFQAADGVHGLEPWRSDGTEAGTVMVKDVALGPNSGLNLFSVASFTDVAGTLLFFADDGIHGLEPWRSDGTEAGTQLLADLEPGPLGSGFESLFSLFDFKIVADGRWYFRAYNSRDGIEVWTSAGTAAGTTKLKEVNTQASAFEVRTFFHFPGPRVLADFGGTLLFGADDGVVGRELWRTDGSPGGTSLVKDIEPGPDSSAPARITMVGDRGFFVPSFLPGGQLWVSDGTETGTSLVTTTSATISPSGGLMSELTAFGDLLFFNGASDDLPTGELWSSDGTPPGTQPLRTAGGTASSFPFWLTPHSDRLFYAASGPEGRELWESDGAPGGTKVVKDIRLGPLSSEPTGITSFGSVLLFSASEPTTGRELWRSDGTAAGTSLVKDMRPGPDSGIGREIFSRDLGEELFATAGTRALFAADEGTAGEELWATDGTETGTFLLADVFPGPRSSEIRDLTSAGGRTFFVADDGVHGREVWVSDGTSAGTHLLADILPGAGSSAPRYLRAVGDLLLFAATDGEHGLEPWVSDGTPTGTLLIQDVALGAPPSSTQEFTQSGGLVYFVATDGTTGFELWAVAAEDLALLVSADLALAVSAVPSEVSPGGIVTYTVALTNHGPRTAVDAAWTATLPSSLGFVSLEAPEGWSCSTPAVGTTGAVTCSLALFTPGSADFTLRLEAAPGAVVGSRLELPVAGSSATAEGSPGDESAVVTTPVVEARVLAEIPTLGSFGLGLLLLLIAAAGCRALLVARR